MIDFSLEPYEWQTHMDLLMQNVNLMSIEFLDDYSILLSFLNSFNGEPYKKILCQGVWKFSEENNVEQEERFPCFICDVRVAKLKNTEIESAFRYLRYCWRIPESDDYNMLCMDSGEMSIKLICKRCEVI